MPEAGRAGGHHRVALVDDQKAEQGRVLPHRIQHWTQHVSEKVETTRWWKQPAGAFEARCGWLHFEVVDSPSPRAENKVKLLDLTAF